MRSRKPAAVAALGALAVSTLVSVTAPAAGASTKVAQDSPNSISVLYTNNYVFDTDALAAQVVGFHRQAVESAGPVSKAHIARHRGAPTSTR